MPSSLRYCDCDGDDNPARVGDPAEAQVDALSALYDAMNEGDLSSAELRVVIELVRGGHDLPESVDMVRDAVSAARARQSF